MTIHRRLPPSLAAAIAAGATIVTPNNRLARRLTALHDDAQRAEGARAWPAASILPWRAWLATLWIERATDEPTRLLSPAQGSHLWRTIVGADLRRDSPLVDVRGAASLAQQAWAIVHGFGAGGASWRGFVVQGDDETAFVRWADRYAAALAQRGSEDDARAADALSRMAGKLPVRDRAIVLAGFLDLDPQQQRLVAALAAAGARIERCDTLPSAYAKVGRVEAASPTDELVCALEWAKSRAAADPDTTIGIAVDDLASRRDEIVALAEDLLCARLQWPGEELVARPYNVSLGDALADIPLVATALDLIALAHGPIAIERASALVRSPHLVGASTRWPQRAATERRWLDDGRRSVDWRTCVSALAHDPSLAPRWSRMRDGSVPSRRAPPRAFVDAWRAWLEDAGWPGDRSLSSAEFQALRAFDALIAAFASLAAVGGELTASQALDALRALASETLFQPERPRAPIQIMGMLEAAGMPLDSLWALSLSAERWPAAPRPHPMLPLPWQRERDVPHSSAARELAFARALTDQLARAAPEVIASHARVVDDHRCVTSGLIADWPCIDVATSPARAASAQFAERPALERVVGDRAPPLARDEPVRGGANVIEAQSECPFRAVAKHRLRVEPWEAPAAGLAPWERGRLMHNALAAFWRDLGSHAALVELSREALDARIAAAVAEAIGKLDAVRVRELPPIVLATEPSRLRDLIRDWIEACERERAPFSVRAVEQAMTLAIGGLSLSTRLDRVDSLDGGGAAIIDYKSGEIAALRRWFDARPSATQLAQYALAWRAAGEADPLRAVAFAQVAPGMTKATGVAADESAWPSLTLASRLPAGAPRDWAETLAWWHDTMAALASDFAAGEAAVDPRERAVCERCGMQALCRVDAIGATLDANDDA